MDDRLDALQKKFSETLKTTMLNIDKLLED